MNDVVIIGAGLAGYTAAHYLATKNASVLMLEKSGTVGGRAKTKKINGQYFNTGPHAVYKTGEGCAILEQLGIQLSGQSPKLNGELFDHHISHALPFNIHGLLTTSYLSWKERVEWMRIVLRISRVKLTVEPQQTYQQWVEQNVHSDKVKHLLYVLGRLASYCHAPDLISAKVMLAQLKTSLGGVLYMDGGWKSLVDQLHNKAVMLGVQIQTDSNVQHITADRNDCFELTLSNRQIIHARNVIYTGEPQELNRMLNFDHQYNNFISGITAVKGAFLDVALTELPQPKRLYALGAVDPLYFSVHSPYAKLSECGDSIILHCFKYYYPGEQVNSEKVRLELEQFIETIQPGWKNYKITSRFIPNITVNQRLPRVEEDNPLLQTQAIIPGLYIAGDWASPHSMLLDGAVSSGKRAAEHIIRMMR